MNRQPTIEDYEQAMHEVLVFRRHLTAKLSPRQFHGAIAPRRELLRRVARDHDLDLLGAFRRLAVQEVCSARWCLLAVALVDELTAELAEVN